MLEFKKLQIGYSGKKIFNSLSLNFKPGEAYFFEGDNGSGKTSLAKSIVGLIPILSGELVSTTRNFGLVTVDNNGLIPNYTGREILEFYNKLEINLDLYFNDLIELSLIKESLEKKCENMSSGMRQCMKLMISLLPQNQIIIWDEPFKSLSIENKSKIISKLNKYRINKVFLILDHNVFGYEDLKCLTYRLEDLRN